VPCIVVEDPRPTNIDVQINHVCGATGMPSAKPLQQDLSTSQEETAKSGENHQNEILKKLENAFQQLTSKGHLETFLTLHS